ncbi:MAG TPA: glycosyl transferase, partial [Microvirga sp.]|nr:glycosyl transferase [Microvirga sp.]
ALRRGRAYGKTGTTTGNADAWFSGWSEGRVLGIWMGRRRGEGAGVALAGSGAPADLFRRIQTGASELDETRRLRPKPDHPVVAENRAAARTIPLPPVRPRTPGES